jgi:hypothetical protein
MTLAEWSREANDLLLEVYAISLDDTGLEDSDLEACLDEGEAPSEFVERFAAKFDLTSRSDWLAFR